jgi:hypothetical protein
MVVRHAVGKPMKRGGVTTEVASAAFVGVTDVDLEPLKHHWWGLSCEARLQALRFTNDGLVQRAWTIQETLYNSELACYQCGIVSQYDETGRPLVSNGLGHFTFEWPAKPALGSATSTGDQDELATAGELASCKPEALVATRQFVEGVDVFAYIEQQLGGILVGGVPFLHRKDVASTFDTPAHSWTEYERQILRLVEVALFQVQNEASMASVATTVLTHAGVVGAENDSFGAEVAAAEKAAAALLDAEDTLAAAAERRAKKKARKKVAAAAKRLATPLRATDGLDFVVSEAAMDDPQDATSLPCAVAILEAAAQKFATIELSGACASHAEGELKLWRRPRLCDLEDSTAGSSCPSTCCPSIQFSHSRNTSTSSSVITASQSSQARCATPMSLVPVPPEVLEGASPAPGQAPLQTRFPSGWAEAWAWNGLTGDSATWSCVGNGGDGWANCISVRHTFLDMNEENHLMGGQALRRRARSLGDERWFATE